MRLLIFALVLAISYAQTVLVNSATSGAGENCPSGTRYCPYKHACVFLRGDTFLEECISEVDSVPELSCEDYSSNYQMCVGQKREWCMWDPTGAGCKDREDKEVWNLQFFQRMRENAARMQANAASAGSSIIQGVPGANAESSIFQGVPAAISNLPIMSDSGIVAPPHMSVAGLNGITTSCPYNTRFCPGLHACVHINSDTFLEECLSEQDIMPEWDCEYYEMDHVTCMQKSQYCYWALTDGCKTREDKDVWNLQYDASLISAGGSAEISAGVSTSGTSATISSSVTLDGSNTANVTVDTSGGDITVDTSGADMTGLLNFFSDTGVIGNVAGSTATGQVPQIGNMGGSTAAGHVSQIGNMGGSTAAGQVPQCGNAGRWCQPLMRCVFTMSDNFLEMCQSETDIGKELSCEDYVWNYAKCSAESEWCYWSVTDGCKDKETIGFVLAKQHGKKSTQIKETSRRVLLLYFLIGTMMTFASFLTVNFCLSLRKSTTYAEDKNVSLI